MKIMNKNDILKRREMANVAYEIVNTLEEKEKYAWNCYQEAKKSYDEAEENAWDKNYNLERMTEYNATCEAIDELIEMILKGL